MKKLNILAAIALAALAAGACSVKETPVIEETPSQEGKVVTLVATLGPKGGADVKALTDPGDGTLSSTWEVGEKICAEYFKKSVGWQKAMGLVTAVDPITGAATVTVSLDDPRTGTRDIYFSYPYELGVGSKTLCTSQIGTLEDVSNYFDYLTGEGMYSYDGTEMTLPTGVDLTRNVCIMKLAFTDGSSSITSDISSLAISAGNAGSYIITPPAGAKDAIYVALTGVTNKDFTFIATTPSGNYSVTKSNITLQNGKYYRSTLALTAAAPAPVISTYRVYTDGSTFTTPDIPGGATEWSGIVSSGTVTSGTYVVSGFAVCGSDLVINGDVNLILRDGAQLTVNGTISGENLNIFGQTASSGKLNIVSNDISVSVENLAIHGGEINVTEGGVMQGLEAWENLDIYHGTVTTAGDANGFMVLGDMHVYGGNVTCSAVHGGALSIYGAGTPGSLTVSGGTFTATAAGVGNCGIAATDGYGDGTASIVFTGGTIVVSGGASDNSNPGGHAIDVCGILTISGNANVTANGGTDAFGTGGGYGINVRAGSSAGGNATISGGTVTATSGPGGMAAINTDGNLTISGATTQIDATGGDMGEGILAGGTITINGGNITATAGENAIGLEGTTTISGGVVTAIGGDAIASSDGDGRAGYDGALTMTGGKLIATGGAGDGTGAHGPGISDGSTIALTGVTMYEGDAANPATPAASQTACTKRYVIIQ